MSSDRDYWTLQKQGSATLAARIQKYWADRGYDVTLTTEPFQQARADRQLYQIRSDMLNGMPVRKKIQP